MFGMNEGMAKAMLLPLKKNLIKKGVKTVVIKVLVTEELEIRAFQTPMVFVTLEQMAILAKTTDTILYTQILNQNTYKSNTDETGV